MSAEASASSVAVRRSTEALLENLCVEHSISPVPKLEWSVRMRRLLGRAYADRGLIRLSAWLSGEQAAATLRHELAHIAAGLGRHQAPHGVRWRRWAERLGVEPRATARDAPASAPPRADTRRYWGLECPSCGTRFARMRVLTGLYHQGCGPGKGTLVKVLRDSRDRISTWAGARG